MLLLKEISRLDSRSTKELTVDDLSLLKIELDSSNAVNAAESARRPRRGGTMYSIASLILLAMYKEIRNQTYAGAIKMLTNRDCIYLGLPRVPSVGTLCHFVTRVLPRYADEIGDELSEAVLKVLKDRVYTVDSMPLEAGRYNFDAKFSPHYEIRMDKAHIIMASGYPIAMVHTDGVKNDNPLARPLLRRLAGMRAGCRDGDVILADGGYDSFVTYAEAWLATGLVMRCNHRENSVFHADADNDGVLKEFSTLRRAEGYDPEMKRDMDSVLRFLCRNGKKELVGKYLRNISMLESESYDGKDTRRQVCESAHRSFKRWISFDIRGLRKRTRKVRIACRFLFLQLLSTLFKGFVLDDGP